MLFILIDTEITHQSIGVFSSYSRSFACAKKKKKLTNSHFINLSTVCIHNLNGFCIYILSRIDKRVETLTWNKWKCYYEILENLVSYMSLECASCLRVMSVCVLVQRKTHFRLNVKCVDAKNFTYFTKFDRFKFMGKIHLDQQFLEDAHVGANEMCSVFQ